MKKMNLRFSYFLLLFLLHFTVDAQTNGYLHQRKINQPESQKYVSITLAPEILAQLKSGWNDVRIFSFSEKDTVEIPYIWETMSIKKEDKVVPFELINTTFDAHYSYLTLKINDKKIINQVKLNITEPDFDKWVQLEGSNDNKVWFTIKERLRIVRFNNGNEHFEYTTLEFPNSQYAYFRLKFDNTFTEKINVTRVYAFETKERKGVYDELKINNWTQTENKKEKKSEIIVELPVSYKVNHITIAGKNNKDFYRNINLYRYTGITHTPKGDIENWYMLNTSVFSSTTNNQISCYDEQIKKLKIEIINNDDQPVEITDIKAFSEQTHLLAELPPSDNLYLLYGKENERSPVYDLVHFKEKIPSSVPEIKYGAEQTITPVLAARNKLITNKNWLWAAMAALMIVIVFFSYRMLKKETL